jgi:hypothetical protein
MVVPGSAPIWPWQAFRFDASAPTPTFEPIGHSQAPGFLSSHGDAINNDGVVVGYSFNQDKESRAFIDIPDGPDAGFYDLQDLLVDGAGWKLETAEDVSDTGYIVGNGTYQGDHRAYLLKPQNGQGQGPFPWNKHIYEAIEAILLLGGATKGGSGIAILPGGKPIPIDPHSPARLRLKWQRMAPAERDAQVGLAIRNLASVLNDADLAEVARRTGTEIAQTALKEINREAR